MIENKICESFNSYILKYRNKPLIEILEDIMMSLIVWKIAKRLTACDDLLCPNIRKKLDKLLNSARLCEMVPAIGEEFEVHYSDETCIVDLMKNECSCNAWALTGIQITCSKCGQIVHNKRTCKQENPRVQQAVVDQTSQGCGVRFSNNVWAMTPGGKKVQSVSGVRAAAVATSNLGVRGHGRSQTTNPSTSARFEARSSQNSKVIDSSTHNPNF
ncbi:hypothetical protein C2S53_004376 [Perilla frutescens var. hirtella]|uniref:Uncharacterized protein n=1 Tax=Perilla frutescens var. hirtella TaxID=608512 RepID=A0AAD4IP22_PERFH|nr:hypothetical protein C2S53_004376 [Perilla frutescens var. hirtella]